jgi:heme-degrading monooxygenase HmoA
MKRKGLFTILGITFMLTMMPLLNGCAYTAPYRTTALAGSGELPPGHPALVALTATEHQPGQRRAFFRDTRRVLDELPEQEGLLGYSFRFEVFGNQAWTLTAWRDEAAMTAFVRSPAHRIAVQQSGDTAQNIRFVRLERPLESLPLPWKDLLPLLENTEPRTYTP